MTTKQTAVQRLRAEHPDYGIQTKILDWSWRDNYMVVQTKVTFGDVILAMAHCGMDVPAEGVAYDFIHEIECQSIEAALGLLGYEEAPAPIPSDDPPMPKKADLVPTRRPEPDTPKKPSTDKPSRTEVWEENKADVVAYLSQMSGPDRKSWGEWTDKQFGKTKLNDLNDKEMAILKLKLHETFTKAGSAEGKEDMQPPLEQAA